MTTDDLPTRMRETRDHLIRAGNLHARHAAAHRLGDGADEIDRLRGRVAELEQERDRLIERWPISGDESGAVYRIDEGPYAGRWFASGWPGDHPTKDAAVRAAAGLDTKGGSVERP